MEKGMEHQVHGTGNEAPGIESRNGAPGTWSREWSTRDMEEGMEHQGSVY